MDEVSSIWPRAGRSLYDWFQTPAGQRVMARETDLLEKALPGLFGYHLLTLGNLQYDLSASPISAKHTLYSPAEVLEDANDGLIGAYTSLPIQRDSVDVLFLPHLLEYSHYPHIVLREAERVIHPDGHIIILGFNPISCYGLCRAVLGFRDMMPWKGYFFHPVRIRDWLQLLGFSIKYIQFTAFTPPFSSENLSSRLQFMERAQNGILAPLGGVYMMVARNLTITPTAIKPRWYKKKKAVLDGAVEPTTRIREKHE